MKKYRNFLATIMFSFSILGVTSITSTAEASFACKGQVKAVSRSITKKAAKWQARATWRARVAKKHGPTYAVWRFAEERSSSCKKSWGAYRCVVRAKPCM